MPLTSTETCEFLPCSRRGPVGCLWDVWEGLRPHWVPLLCTVPSIPSALPQGPFPEKGLCMVTLPIRHSILATGRQVQAENLCRQGINPQTWLGAPRTTARGSQKVACLPGLAGDARTTGRCSHHWVKEGWGRAATVRARLALHHGWAWAATAVSPRVTWHCSLGYWKNS